AIAAVSLLAMPIPAGAQGSGRTVLLTLTEGASLTQLADTVGSLGGRVLATLELADSLLVELPTGVSAPAGSAEIPDTPMKVNGTQQYYKSTVPTYRETIGVPEGAEYGQGVTVALVDTGVAQADGLTTDVNVEHRNVSGAAQGDGLGHGTFLAGLIGGRGKFKGVAPAANVLDVQVADAQGNTSLSKVLAGLDAVQDHGDVDVVNISLSTDSPLPPSFDPLARALERLWAEGVVVVAAAGNDGPSKGTVGSPGNDPVLLTVGALDEINTPVRADDALAEFSSRGEPDSSDKPDLVAPGVSLVSTAASGSIAVSENPGALVGDGYMRGSGTSMSAAVVSGAAAAVLSARPELSPDQVKALLKGTTYALGESDGAGAGALDLETAMSSNVPAPPTQESPSEGEDKWGPSEDDAQAWAEFGTAWESKDKKAAQEAWKALSWRTQQWAARSWSLAVLMASMRLSEEDFKARSWSARSWSLDEWLARSWSARSWSARSWSYEEWLARSWSARSWSARSWSARSWSADEWLARSWSARSWSESDWAARSWSARSWSARSWSARSWSDFSWEARSWSARSWSARSWSMTA
ncbi:MAG TPA: S8 family serine peptidase, partial [Dermatophilaceae bacterium]|nr:S8 family serine peptidase [Dermatophilaceae bacterium]